MNQKYTNFITCGAVVVCTVRFRCLKWHKEHLHISINKYLINQTQVVFQESKSSTFGKNKYTTRVTLPCEECVFLKNHKLHRNLYFSQSREANTIYKSL